RFTFNLGWQENVRHRNLLHCCTNLPTAADLGFQKIVCSDAVGVRECYPLLSLPLLSLDALVPHSRPAGIGIDRHTSTCKYAQTHTHTHTQTHATSYMLWSGVNAENARTQKILAAVAFARREKSLQFIFLTCCWCGVGGMQLIGWCVIEGAWGTCVSPPAQQLHVLPSLFCCSSADVGFFACAG
ncbi:hypothetical protein TcCL_NonESM08348, partial [Trypanosoma cruzi]